MTTAGQRIKVAIAPNGLKSMVKGTANNLAIQNVIARKKSFSNIARNIYGLQCSSKFILQVKEHGRQAIWSPLYGGVD
ncbi:MAG: hypothetical protein D6726_08030 [Nitrospirae bacterium]|nr:MAG: hypothetical protein D6726_08030 [Nitrospirota bacterium]